MTPSPTALGKSLAKFQQATKHTKQTNTMKIVKLTAENVKRLSAVEITPTGALVVVGGENAAGKTSVLDSIEYALGGKPADTMPVRRGEERARIVVDLGELVVKRVFSATGGTALVVQNADGQPQQAPQAILDKLLGRLSFDPLEFSRQAPREQGETLARLVGLDFTEHDQDRERVYRDRTALNREVSQLQASLATMPKVDGLPAEEVSIAAILSEQQTAQAKNSTNAYKRDVARGHWSAVLSAQEGAKKAEQEVARLSAALTEARLAFEGAKALVNSSERTFATAKAESDACVDVDLTPFRKRAEDAERTNAAIRAQKRRAEVVESLKAKSTAADKLTAKLEDLDSGKRKKIAGAKWPVPGLALDAGRVMLENVPLAQASSAEQLRVSVAIGLALNPKLKVLLIRDGSLLDAKNLALVGKMAEEAAAQVWIERVGTDGSTSVIIEDGHVQEAAKPQTQQKGKP